jgi:hypothetical protein
VRYTVSKCTLRIVFTILMYAGVAVFLIPYITGRVVTEAFVLLAGAGAAVTFGLLRCYCTEGDCAEKHIDSKPRI